MRVFIRLGNGKFVEKTLEVNGEWGETRGYGRCIVKSEFIYFKEELRYIWEREGWAEIVEVCGEFGTVNAE